MVAVLHGQVLLMLRGLPRAGRLRIQKQLPIRCVGGTSDANKKQRQVLFLSPVWPERSSSAAGVRTADLVESFQEWGYGVAYSSPSKPNSHSELLQQQGVRVYQCAPNREEELAAVLHDVAPTICIFDRFYAEEAFSFRVRELVPGAMRMLDMQDVHFLRAGRQELAGKGASIDEVMRWKPNAEAPECLRELASIHRSDLTLVCSPEELQLLVEHYGVPQHKLVLAPFFTPASPYAPTSLHAAPAAATASTVGSGPVHPASTNTTGQQQQQQQQVEQRQWHLCPPFSSRRHFMMIGNFRHPPNADSVEWACHKVWPLIRAQLAASQELPGGQQGHRQVVGEQRDSLPELHIYGSYAPGGAQRLHKPKEGVHVKGFAPSLDIMLDYRVGLAPLRFGAGLKGKVVDSWWHGLPVCTTPVGAEGMQGQQPAAGHNTHSSRSSSTSAVDPAEEGYIWQMGGADKDRVYASGSDSRGGSGTGGDPARQGHPWQMGPEPQQALASSSDSSSQEDQQWQRQGAAWGGLWQAESAEHLAADAVRLYTDERLWAACQLRGFELLQELYNRERNLALIKDAVEGALDALEQRRVLDFVGQMLWQQQLRATEFMSRWIELKEKWGRT